jgi:hypothetical protein
LLGQWKSMNNEIEWSWNKRQEWNKRNVYKVCDLLSLNGRFNLRSAKSEGIISWLTIKVLEEETVDTRERFVSVPFVEFTDIDIDIVILASVCTQFQTWLSMFTFQMKIDDWKCFCFETKNEWRWRDTGSEVWDSREMTFVLQNVLVKIWCVGFCSCCCCCCWCCCCWVKCVNKWLRAESVWLRTNVVLNDSTNNQTKIKHKKHLRILFWWGFKDQNHWMWVTSRCCWRIVWQYCWEHDDKFDQADLHFLSASFRWSEYWNSHDLMWSQQKILKWLFDFQIFQKTHLIDKTNGLWTVKEK